ncbi:SUMO1/Ulp2 [Novymonas esmeraldas]|uniref:SUMO1/Ulp2 n=1 Tax=Novymonas esmeraldas TaxID=1808958 RepID=A0AAW0ENB4_9TRYP
MAEQPSSRHEGSAALAAHRSPTLPLSSLPNAELAMRRPDGSTPSATPPSTPLLDRAASRRDHDWGRARSPAIHPPAVSGAAATVSATVAPPPPPRFREAHLLAPSSAQRTAEERGGQPAPAGASSASADASAAATTHSSTPPSCALVMDSLVRRYHAEEQRLLQWRSGGARGVPSAARRHRGAGGRARPLRRATATASTPAGGCEGGGADASLVGGLCSTLVGVAQRTAIVRAVQGWWRGRSALMRLSHTAGKRPRTAAGTADATASLSWMGRASSRVLGRWPHSLYATTGPGQAAKVRLLRRASDGTGSRSDTDAEDSDGEEAPAHAPAVPGAEEGLGTAALRDGAATAHLSSASSCSSRGSSVGRGGVGPTAGPVTGHRDDGSFTLAWVRGLRVGASAAAPSVPAGDGDAEDSFRSASRLLSRSRARFARWLRRQERLHTARRSPRGATASPASSTPAASPSARPVAPPQSELHRRAAQAALSSWEAPLFDSLARADSGPSAARPTRAQLLEQLAAAVAAGTAAWRAQHVREPTPPEPPHGGPAAAPAAPAPALSRAEQREREHAEDLVRLTESLAALEQLSRATPLRAVGGDAPNAGAGYCPPSLPPPPPGADASLSHDVAQLHCCSVVSAGRHRHHHASAASSSTSAAEAHERNSGAEVLRSLVTDTTHTAVDVAVRSAYEAVIADVCTSLARGSVEAALDVSRGAAEHALTQWMERQTLYELTRPQAQTAPPPLLFTGVTRHIHSGVAVSLEHLRLDDADREVLVRLSARCTSDDVAARLDKGGFSLSYRALATLRPGSWLNDEVINTYLQLLCEETGGTTATTTSAASVATASSPDAPRRCRHGVASMGTHFYTVVAAEMRRLPGGAEGLPPLGAGSGVLRWFRNRRHLLEPHDPANNPQSARVVLVPVNIEAEHWALAVLYNAEGRWVLYDSMCRSHHAQRRGAAILAHLSHAWRESQRHFGIVGSVCPSSSSTTAAADAAADGQTSAAAVSLSPWAAACVIAAPFVPVVDASMAARGTAVSPLDSLQPFGSLDEMRRAAKRVRHQEALLAESAPQRCRGESAVCGAGPDGRALVPLTAATTLPAGQLSDTEVEWFTGGFHHVPQQANGHDCGVFVCQVAWCVAQGVAVSFTQSDITRVREVMQLELFHKRLLRRYPTSTTSSSASV